MQLRDIFFRALTPQIAPMVYVMMMVSVIIGFCFMTGLGVDPSTSILYRTGTLVPTWLWGAVLFTTASVAEIGFITHTPNLIKFGGIFGFCAWAFVCISLAMTLNWYGFLTFGFFHLLFHAYVYLATSFNLIFRAPVFRR